MNNLARVWALRAGVTMKDTIGRLRAARPPARSIDPTATELVEAFHFLWDVRLHHQVDQVVAGEAPDDFIDPATLGLVLAERPEGGVPRDRQGPAPTRPRGRREPRDLR